MNPVDPAELSAYLDGELDESRRQEVEKALADEPLLRADLEQLRAMDAAWTSAARSAVSRPNIRLAPQTTTSRFGLRIAIAIMVLLAVRILPKLSDNVLVWGVVLHAIALVVALAWTVRLARNDD